MKFLRIIFLISLFLITDSVYAQNATPRSTLSNASRTWRNQMIDLMRRNRPYVRRFDDFCTSSRTELECYADGASQTCEWRDNKCRHATTLAIPQVDLIGGIIPVSCADREKKAQCTIDEKCSWIAIPITRCTGRPGCGQYDQQGECNKERSDYICRWHDSYKCNSDGRLYECFNDKRKASRDECEKPILRRCYWVMNTDNSCVGESFECNSIDSQSICTRVILENNVRCRWVSNGICANKS